MHNLVWQDFVHMIWYLLHSALLVISIFSQLLSVREDEDTFIEEDNEWLLKTGTDGIYAVRAAIRSTCCCTLYVLLYGVRAAVHCTCCYTEYVLLYAVLAAIRSTCCCTLYVLIYGVLADVRCMCCCTDWSEMKTAYNAHFCTVKMSMKIDNPQRLILEN